MRKTKNVTFCLLLLLLVCALVGCLCACSSGVDGTNGKDGANGKSAYEIWLDEGHSGSQSDFLNWLKGSDGSSGQNGSNGQNGTDGKSAYQIWLDNGHTGTETDFLTWLKGADGKDGLNGQNGTDGQDGAKGDKGETGAQGEKGQDGLSAFETFMKYYPYYTGSEEQWIKGLVNGELNIHTITFKSEVADDMVKYVFEGYALTDIPEVPIKEGQTSAVWSVTDFTNIKKDTIVNAVYDMRKYITFHNEFTDDADIIKTVNYGESLTDIPAITEKAYNDSKWSIADFSLITKDIQVEAIYQTQGLQFSFTNQQTQYKVSKGEMNAQTQELFIPSEYNGKPVTKISENAFSSCKFKYVHISNGIIDICDSAFNNCTELTTVKIPNSVRTIEKSAFSSCKKLTDIEIPYGVEKIEQYAFRYCGLTNITIPSSVISFGYYFSSVFQGCTNLNSVVFEAQIESMWSQSLFEGCTSLTIVDCSFFEYIGYYMFQGCTNLTSIILDKNLTWTGSGAFAKCTKFQTIYFKGTAADFNEIRVSNDDPNFTDATVYYYSPTKPIEDGFYWHYDTDGVTPVIWIKE